MRVRACMCACVRGCVACMCVREIVVGRGSADSVLCALNSDTFTVTYVENLEYIDYRTFNLITYTMYSAGL